MTTYDNLKGLLDHKHYGSDIIDITSYIGQPLGIFTTAYPSSPSIGRYDFAGTDGATVSGTVYNNGDSAFWNGSVWTRIPKQVINIEQVRSQSTNLAPSSKLMDDELTIKGNNDEALAIELLRTINPDWVFSGFINTTTTIPTHVANKAYIAISSGTIFGVSNVVKGQIVWSNGFNFIVESNQVLLEPQKNKYNSVFAIDNRLYDNSTGNMHGYIGASVTGKIPVLPSTVYSIWKTGSGFGLLHFYDTNGVWIGSNSTLTGVVTNISGGYSFTTPSNCYFIGTWGHRNTETFDQWKGLVMLELGAKTTYEAYTLKLKSTLFNSYTKTEVDSSVLSAKNEAITIAGNNSKLYTDSNITKIYTLLPNNIIVGEGTQTPTVVTINNGTNLTVTAVPNDIIYPSQYAYKRRYLGIVSSGLACSSWQVNYPSVKPSIISFAYWVKDSDIDAVYTGKGNQQNWWLYDAPPDGMIHNTIFDNVSIKESIGKTVSGTFNYTGKMSGKWEVICIDKQNGYSRIVINWYDIIYDSSYTKTSFLLYQIFNGVVAEFNGKTIDYVGFTLIFNEKITNSSVYPDSSGKLQYPKTLLSLDSRVTNTEAKLDSFLISQIGNTTVVKSGGVIYVRTRFDDTRDLVQSFNVLYNESNFSNNNIHYYNVYLINKTNGNTVDDLTINTLAHLLHAGDDRTPNNYNGTYIGGGHGCSDARLITVNSHGKANVDIGSEWVDDSGRKYYILRIVNSNQLWVISENIGTGDIWQFDNTISGTTLTHSANATHTSTMTISANEMVQLTPAIKNNTKAVYLDGKTQVTTDGVYNCSFCDIVEQYDIVNPASMLLNLISTVGTAYTDTTLNSAFKNGNSSVFNQILYRIQQNGALQIIYGWRNYQQINLNYMGFMQVGTPMTTTYPKLKLYMPKILPISDGVKTWNFRNIEDYDVSENQIPEVISTYWENPLSPPERAVEFLCDTNGGKKIGFAVGYDLTKGIGKVRKDVVRNAWFFYTSRKLYPRGIDDKINPLLANSCWYSCIGYRIFFNAENPLMGSASTFYHYELGKEVIVVFDYHTQVAFNVLQLPVKYIGMTVTVVEKSDNITIHTNEVMQNGITVSVGAGNYGFCILKLS